MNDDNNPFDRLFGFGSDGKEWTTDMIDEFMGDMESSFFEMPDIDVEEYEAYRRTNLDGQTIEEVFVDGEWKTLKEAKEGEMVKESFEFDQSDGEYHMTVDMSTYLPTGEFVVSATINNGVLDISFIPE